MIDWGIAEEEPSIIKVIGVGGGGGNAVNHMYKTGIRGVEFLICNTDYQHLLYSPVPSKLQIGYSITEGRGAGGRPEIGRQAAEDSFDLIKSALNGKTKMLFITTGMGGGTGTGAAPIIAKIARDLDILTVGIVTYPFELEGPVRKKIADKGIEELKKNVDALIVIYNERLMEKHINLPYTKAFAYVDNICASAARGIAEIITISGNVNVDFEDVKNIMKNCGTALVGMAVEGGENRAFRAIKSALDSPLIMDSDILGAENILLNIVYGSREVTLKEVKIMSDYIREKANSEVDIKVGQSFDQRLEDKISVTVIATYLKNNKEREEEIKQDKKIRFDLVLDKTEADSLPANNDLYKCKFQLEIENEPVPPPMEQKKEDIPSQIQKEPGQKKEKLSLIEYIKKLIEEFKIWMRDEQDKF